MYKLDASSAAEVARLWVEYREQLVRFAAVVVGPTDAEEIAHDAFLRSAHRIVDGSVSSPTSYLYRAVTNLARDLQRGRSRRWRRDLHAVGPRSVSDPDANVDVRRAVAELSPAQRAVVYLVYWEDRSEREAAQVLGVSPSTVREHLVRAQRHLRKALA